MIAKVSSSSFFCNHMCTIFEDVPAWYELAGKPLIHFHPYVSLFNFDSTRCTSIPLTVCQCFRWTQTVLCTAFPINHWFGTVTLQQRGSRWRANLPTAMSRWCYWRMISLLKQRWVFNDSWQLICHYFE